MPISYPESWSGLKQPWLRSELLAYLEELATPDPRPLWEEARRRGLSSGIDEVFHFLFDDHDFGDSDVGCTLFGRDEAAAIGAVKRTLQSLLAELGDVQDDMYVGHPNWPQVTAAASAARGLLALR